jgi:DNA-binding CsgD family transcriptional regulator/tetratricopeptide (TPR) repeat protein
VTHAVHETPLLGREDDLARIVRATEPGGLAVLAGPAGIGKTRLVTELARATVAAGATVVLGHCVGQAGAAMPYLPITELLARLEAGDPATLDQVLARHPVLARLLPGRAQTARDVPEPGAIAEAVHAALTAAGADNRVLLVIEDVHWADHATRDLLTLLLTRGFATDVSLLLTYRSDDLHRRHPLHETLAYWARLEGVRHLHLGPLADGAISDLVRGLAAEPSAEVVADVTRRAEGNPFFAEELAMAAGCCALSDTLTRVLLARYENLEPDTRGVLRAIAAHGRHISHELLTRVLPVDPDQLDGSLRAAVDGGMLVVDRGGYAFRHALLAEAIGEDLLPGERTRLHRAYVAALLGDAGLAPPSDLERHAAAAGDVPTAIAAAVDAGRAAFALGGPRDALDHFEKALTWMDEDHPARDVVTLEAARAAHTSGDVARAIQVLADRLAHPGTRQSGDERARLLAALARQARYSDRDRHAAGERAAEAYALISGEHTATRLEVLVAHLEHLLDERQYAAAAPIGEEARALAVELGLDDVEIELRTVLVRGMYRTGDLETMEANLRHAIADGRGDPSVQVLARLQLAILERSRGNLAAELALHDEGARIAISSGRWGVWETLARVQGATIAYELGDFGGALVRLELHSPAPSRAAEAPFRAGRMLVRAARDGTLGDDLDEVRQYWDEGYVALLSAAAAIDAFGFAGEPEKAVAVTRDALAVLDAAWGADHEAIIRLAALITGVVADAVPSVDRGTAERWVALAEEYAGRAEDIARLADPLGDESRVWLSRVQADMLRLRWRAGVHVELEGLLEAWRTTVREFEEYGHAYELARSRLRLAEVLRAAGERAEAEELCRAVTTAAESLPSEPLRRALAGMRHGTSAAAPVPAPAERRARPPALTARETEVLHLLARGRTNGQIASQLFISVKTASVHVTHIIAKLGASSRGEAVALARDQGLLG